MIVLIYGALTTNIFIEVEGCVTKMIDNKIIELKNRSACHKASIKLGKH